MKFVDDSPYLDQPYPELREVLTFFLQELQNTLTDNLVGVYMIGSLATGDFDLDSDVDFLAVIRNELAEENVASLEAVMRRMHGMGYYPAKHLEGSFITLPDLADWNTVGIKKLVYFDNGSTKTELSTHDNQWHVRWILRERPFILFGPHPSELLPPIPLQEMREETKKALQTILDLLEKEISGPLTFINSRFGQSFAVLTACRFLHTVATNTVQSKKAGMDWALQSLNPRWHDLIQRAWVEREGVRFCIKIKQLAEQDKLKETLAFVRYAVGLMEKLPLKDLRVSLRPFTEFDIETCRRWAENINAAQYQSRIFPRAFNGRNLSGGKDLWAWYVIQVDGVDAGTVWLEKESPEKDKAILGIMLGREEFFGRGIGREAVKQAIDQAQESLGFNRVVLTVRKNNTRAIASYRHVGFAVSEEGVRTMEDGSRIPFYAMKLEME